MVNKTCASAFRLNICALVLVENRCQALNQDYCSLDNYSFNASPIHEISITMIIHIKTDFLNCFSSIPVLSGISVLFGYSMYRN